MCGECGGSGYYGCTDPAADNYDAGACTEDPEAEMPCIYYGCMDSSTNSLDTYNACNYDPTANVDDGSCEYVLPIICYEYNDSTGVFEEVPTVAYDCAGTVLPEYDENMNGVADCAEAIGCTDFVAANYDADANVDDGSRKYADVYPSACNTPTPTTVMVIWLTLTTRWTTEAVCLTACTRLHRRGAQP